jgi:hypothetical protein
LKTSYPRRQTYFFAANNLVNVQTLEQLQSGGLKGIKHLRMKCGLSEFPQEILELEETLELLELSGNKLSSLPDDFSRLKKLKVLFLSDNLFTELPAILGQCENLEMIGFKSNQIETVPENSLPEKTRWLILTNNRIKALPKSIGQCYRMQKLALAGNQLKELPVELSQCKNLGLLRISANQLQAFPEWLLAMPKLSWLAFAGNPFCYKPIIETDLLEIDWHELALEHELGQGASGIISKAVCKPSNIEVAVKVFKGSVTSDGFPEDEMNACILAGNHDGLVKVIGKIKNHPQEKEGLLLGLIPPHFCNLGLPPSFETCTRDVFKDGTSLTVQQIIKIVLTIADVCDHLHSKGIMHGDLYAHNILVDEHANSLKGDFGAASMYNVNDKAIAEGLEKIEVSAWGCLLEDLLNNIYPNEKDNPLLQALIQLKENAMQPTVINRPSFVQILEQLKAIII